MITHLFLVFIPCEIIDLPEPVIPVSDVDSGKTEQKIVEEEQLD